MIDIDEVIKEVAKKTNIDQDIVNSVCKHVFNCTINVMKDDEDYRDILFNGLFKFKLKPRFKLNKTANYSPKL